jgi:hypothetical protein
MNKLSDKLLTLQRKIFCHKNQWNRISQGVKAYNFDRIILTTTTGGGSY